MELGPAAKERTSDEEHVWRPILGYGVTKGNEVHGVGRISVWSTEGIGSRSWYWSIGLLIGEVSVRLQCHNAESTEDLAWERAHAVAERALATGLEPWQAIAYGPTL